MKSHSQRDTIIFESRKAHTYCHTLTSLTIVRALAHSCSWKVRRGRWGKMPGVIEGVRVVVRPRYVACATCVCHMCVTWSWCRRSSWAEPFQSRDTQLKLVLTSARRRVEVGMRYPLFGRQFSRSRSGKRKELANSVCDNSCSPITMFPSCRDSAVATTVK